MTDPIADMLTRIRNALAVSKAEVRLPYSKTKEAVARVLASNDFISGVTLEGDMPRRELVLALDNDTSARPITEIHRISKPGRRVYVTADKIPSILRGRGIVVISTSSGVMSGGDARRKGTGGELMCKVW